MADTLNPRPRRRNMLVLLGVLLLGVLLLGVVAAGWGFWSRIRERHRVAALAAGIPARTRGNPRVGCRGHCRGVLHRSIAGAGPASGAGQPPGDGGRGRADAHAEAGPRCRARGRQARAARVRCRDAGAT